MIRAGIDIGGTFTDIALDGAGPLRVHKVRSTPSRPEEAVADGVAQLAAVGLPLAITHGSTVATNAFLEGKGARTAFVATRGFEDLLFLARQTRPSLYDLAPPPRRRLLGDDDTYGAAERVGPDGRPRIVLSPARAGALASRIARAGHEGAAVCFLFSYLAPAHERQMARALARAGVEAHASSEVLPRAGEFERASATFLNAYLGGRVRSYLEALSRWAEGSSLSIMKSSGGTMTAAAAARMAIHTILSGPAGGVVGAMQLAGGLGRVITFDMGGTSTDVALVEGRPRVTHEYVVDGWPLGIPVLDIRTIGAGGGSIARVDPGGALRVGPSSAGAEPGPACYGRGEDLTVTDAHVVLGHIPPDRFLGGRQRLYPGRAHRVARTMARRLAMEPAALARGVLAVVRSSMERAIRAVSVARGHRPADFVLVAFGGAGGLHAFYLARALGIQRVVVPRFPGALSAIGMLGADRTAEAELGLTSRRRRGRAATGTARVLGARPAAALEERFRRLETANRAELGIDSDPSRHPPAAADTADRLGQERLVCLRYVHRSEVIDVPWTDWSTVLAGFHSRHRALHGIADPAEPVELVGVRARAVIGGLPSRYPPVSTAQGRPVPVATVLADLGEGPRRVGVHDRAGLGAGHVVVGPAIVVDETGTTLVPRGFQARVDGEGHLWGEPR